MEKNMFCTTLDWDPKKLKFHTKILLSYFVESCIYCIQISILIIIFIIYIYMYILVTLKVIAETFLTKFNI